MSGKLYRPEWRRRTASVLPLDSGFPPNAPRTGQGAFTTSGGQFRLLFVCSHIRLSFGSEIRATSAILAHQHASSTRMDGVPYDRLHAYGSLILRARSSLRGPHGAPPPPPARHAPSACTRGALCVPPRRRLVAWFLLHSDSQRHMRWTRHLCPRASCSAHSGRGRDAPRVVLEEEEAQ